MLREEPAVAFEILNSVLPFAIAGRVAPDSRRLIARLVSIM
jgi:hypothetical protein